MTPEHEEAVRLARNHSAVIVSAVVNGREADVERVWLTPEQLAALIAEVRRQKGEEDAAICDAQQLEPECPERAKYCADAIRARLEGGK